ncbi:MAG: aldo/keto reductase [Bacteroidales bacterium]|nr:aldo/keto reductase [Bacteroidales bacterium]
MKRRKFIQLSAAGASMLSVFPSELSGINRIFKNGTMEKREYGSTGEMLSILGFGGVVVMDSTPAQASEWISKAYDRGINYFDVAPTYGNAEERMGPALEPYRKNVFLACKTTKRTATEARAELELSLKNLRTDHFDLYQLHAVTTLEEVETIFGKGGAMETFEKARQEGLIRYIGFSAHSVEAAMALLDRYTFNSILFPLNLTCWHKGNFGPQVLEKARNQGAAILALKAMAKGPWPEGAEKIPKCWYEPLTDPDEALEGLRFTLSHPITAAIPPGNEKLYFMALDLIDKFTPLSTGEALAIKEKAMDGVPLFRYPAEQV